MILYRLYCYDLVVARITETSRMTITMGKFNNTKTKGTNPRDK